MTTTQTSQAENRLRFRLSQELINVLDSFAQHSQTSRNGAARALLTSALTVTGDQSIFTTLVSIEKTLLGIQELLHGIILSQDVLRESTASAVYLTAAMQKEAETIDLDRLQEVITDTFYPPQDSLESS